MKRMRQQIFLISMFLIIAGIQQAGADIIHPVSGSSSAPLAYSTQIVDVIDGVADFNSYLAVGTQGFGAWNGPYTIRFDLGEIFNLSSFNLWNNAGNIENDGEGVYHFSLKFFDTVFDEVSTLFQSIAADTLAEQNFGIAVSGVRYVDFIIEDAHSLGTGYDDFNGRWVSTERGYAAFYEIDFDGTLVPVPSSMIILGISLIVLSGICRRKS